MRKLLVALMIVAFAATAFADVSLSGYYWVKGQYKKNIASVDNNSDDVNQYYEQEFKVWMKAQPDKDTYFKAKLQIADNSWAVNGKKPYSDNASTADLATGSVTSPDESTDFQVERLWMGHNFGFMKLDVGLMNGGAWAYSFGNNVEGYYRVKATIPAGPGNVLAIIQKNDERANSGVTVKDANKDDGNTYYLAYSGKFAGFTVAPLFAYGDGSNTDLEQSSKGSKTYVYDLGVGGNFGMIGFESEFKYVDKSTVYSNNVKQHDGKNWGAMANVFANVSGAQVGFLTAYASSDKTDGTFDMADDFDDTYLFVLGDDGVWNSGDTVDLGGNSGIGGAWVNQVYANYDVNDKLMVGGAFSYLTSTMDKTDKNGDANALNDASAYEADLMMNYAITKSLSYTVMLGYAKVDLDHGTDPDPAVHLFHKLQVSF